MAPPAMRVRSISRVRPVCSRSKTTRPARSSSRRSISRGGPAPLIRIAERLRQLFDLASDRRDHRAAPRRRAAAANGAAPSPGAAGSGRVGRVRARGACDPRTAGEREGRDDARRTSRCAVRRSARRATAVRGRAHVAVPEGPDVVRGAARDGRVAARAGRGDSRARASGRGGHAHAPPGCGHDGGRRRAGSAPGDRQLDGASTSRCAHSAIPTRFLHPISDSGARSRPQSTGRSRRRVRWRVAPRAGDRTAPTLRWRSGRSAPDPCRRSPARIVRRVPGARASASPGSHPLRTERSRHSPASSVHGSSP